MFPIGDTDVKGSGPGILTIVLIVINVLAFLFELSLGQSGLRDFVQQYGVVPTEITQGNQLYSLFTSMFLHGGWVHLISNMLFLGVFGDNVEATLGKIYYLGFYLLGGLAASATFVLVNLDSNRPSIGASGAVAALLGAYIVMFPESRVKALVVVGFWGFVTRVQALLFLGIWFITQLFNGVATLGVDTAQTGGIAVWAHIGGFVFGLIIGFLFRNQAGKLEFEGGRV
jgi:membrane associated rhomboid family serine protease